MYCKTVLSAVIFHLVASSLLNTNHRNKRSLIWPTNPAVMQVILGVGIPVDLEIETVIVGVNIRGVYGLIQNSTWITNPGIIYARKKRSSTSRWDIYSFLAGLAEYYGFSGKSCILRTICELSSSPLDKGSGLIEEMLHTLFTPSTTNEDLNHHSDNEYHAAQKMGLEEANNCKQKFPDCKRSMLEMFTMLS